MAADFLRVLHSNLADGEYIQLKALLNGSKPKTAFFTDSAKALDWADEHADEYNVYVGICPRNGKNGTAEHIQRGYWVWLDLDGYKPGAEYSTVQLEERLGKRFVLPPTMVVDSGSGSLHVYWAIEPTNDLKLLQTVNDAVADMFQADHVGDPVRVLRVPGTLNHKFDPPRDVILKYCRPELVYTLGDLAGAVNVVQKIARRVHTGDKRGYRSRSERDWAVIRELMLRGVSEEAIVSIFRNRRIGDKLQESGETYLLRTIEKLRDKVTTDVPVEVLATPVKEGGGPSTLFMEGPDDCWWTHNQDGSPRKVSTFVFVPEVLLEGNSMSGDPDTLLGHVKAAGYTWENVALTRKAFSRVDSLLKELPMMAWQWLGTDREVRSLLPFLMEKLRAQGDLPKRSATPVLGLHGSCFVSPGSTLAQGGIEDPDEAEVVWLPTKRVHPIVEFKWIDDDVLVPELNEFVDLYKDVNEPHVVWPTLGFYCAAFIKPRLEELGWRFPILNLFGTRGSGKTSMLTTIMQPLTGYKQRITWDFNSTKFVMLSLLGSTNAFPVSFSEYRRASARDDTLERFIRLSYDAGMDARGRADQTTETYNLSAPFTVDGEDSVADPACLERIIAVNMQPETIAEGTRAYLAFELLQEVDLQGLGTRLMAYALTYEPNLQAATDLTKALYPQALPDRVRRNLVVIVVGLQLFQDFAVSHGVEFPEIDFLQAFTPILENVVSLSTGRTALFIDEMIQDCINRVAQDDQAEPFLFTLDAKNQRLYFHLATATSWWFAHRRRQGLPVLDTVAIKNQLKERTVDDNSRVLGPGFYVVGRGGKTVDGKTMWMYEIDLKAAADTGLDIPTELRVFSLREAK